MDENIEESARFYKDDNGELHIRSDFLVPDASEPHTVRVAFILNLVKDELKSKGMLFSIHDEDVPLFRLLRKHAPCPGLIDDEGKNVSSKVLSGNMTDALAGEVLGAYCPP
jgi:magnesium transporter